MAPNNLSVILWNVRHLDEGKLQEDDLIWDLLSRHDIIICVETHGTRDRPTEGYQLQGYQAIAADRPEVRGRGDGGVAVFVHSRLAGAVEVLARSAEPRGCESVWIRLRSDWVGAGGRSLLVGAYYCAPETSSYHRQERPEATDSEVALDVFASLQARLSAFRRDSDLVLLAGDFNARMAGGATGVQDLPDVTMAGLAELVGTPFGYDDGSECIPRLRGCTDTHVNHAGRELGNVCRSEGLCVLNGRVRGDEHGALTFNNGSGNGSTVDLFVASTGL